MNKVLYILRGLPGSGKSTFAHTIADEVWEADRYFEVFHLGKFKPSEIGEAHKWCKEQVEYAMKENVRKLAVANTSTEKWEMQPYFNLAEKYGYTAFSIIVENRHGGESVHSVPEKVIEKMRNRFEVKL